VFTCFGGKWTRWIRQVEMVLKGGGSGGRRRHTHVTNHNNNNKHRRAWRVDGGRIGGFCVAQFKQIFRRQFFSMAFSSRVMFINTNWSNCPRKPAIHYITLTLTLINTGEQLFFVSDWRFIHRDNPYLVKILAVNKTRTTRSKRSSKKAPVCGLTRTESSDCEYKIHKCSSGWPKTSVTSSRISITAHDCCSGEGTRVWNYISGTRSPSLEAEKST